MRILWSSNSPFCTTGYGTQTASTTTHLQRMGHDMAIFAFFGLAGSKVDWGDIPIYPNDPGDFGIKHAKMFFDDWQADILITLVDVWVLGDLNPSLRWVPWIPIDHDPVPPFIVDELKKHPAIIKVMVQTKWGQKKLKEKGIDSIYMPNDFDTKLFSPRPEWRETGRKKYEWEDKFVVGCVGTNHNERKNWVTALKAVKMLESRHPGEIAYYMHCNPMDPRGINLLSLRESLGMDKYTFFPSACQVATGIDRETMVRTYNVFDVFLLPSKGEGFCRPIVEAQACGVPVITTKCTSQQELVAGGWFIEDLKPFWTLQNSWQFDCQTEEVAELLEEAYQAKKNGSIVERGRIARQEAEKYDESVLYTKYWPKAIAEIEEALKSPRNLEGIQPFRQVFIPRTCIPRKVLDLGSGTTTPYKESLEPLGEYVAVDKRGGKGVKKCDAHRLPFEDGEFGFVWCSELLEHVESPKRVLAEAKRVGRHGVCIFSTPQNPHFKGDPDHKIVHLDYTTLASGDGMITW